MLTAVALAELHAAVTTAPSAGTRCKHGKRGAVATARQARRGTASSATGWLVSKAAPRWENREHRPLMFRRLRGEPEGPRRGHGMSTGGERVVTSPARRRPRKDRRTYVYGKPPPDDTNGGTTSMTVSKIAPERRARRTAARTGGSIPSEWGPVVAQTADFEPENDGELLDWMGRQVTGMSA